MFAKGERVIPSVSRADACDFERAPRLDEALVQSQLAVNLCSAADLARNAGKVLAPPDKNFERSLIGGQSAPR